MAEPIRIDDPLDPRIEAFRDVRERDLIGREGRFVAEGTVVLRVLLTLSRHRPEALLIAEPRLAGLGELIGMAPEGVPVYVAAQPVMDAIAGFPIHRGVLAIGRRTDFGPVASLLAAAGARSVVVVLCGIANHDNMGGIFRNAAAFGADAVLLDPTCCEPLYRKSIRVSVGGALVVPFARLARGEDPVALLKEAGYRPLALSPAGALPLADLLPPARAAIILGAEGPGLPRPILDRADTVAIPMRRGFDSLNVATTSGIVLHHLTAGARS
jgi:tRNA G18 (ribose-2'-O)-methylase SpoU